MKKQECFYAIDLGILCLAALLCAAMQVCRAGRKGVGLGGVRLAGGTVGDPTC